MANDAEFIRSLRIVLTHLVKHVEPVDDAILAIGLANEEGEWKKFSAEKKYSYVKKLIDYLSAENPIVKHYNDYPHEYSKERFQSLLEEMNKYAEALKAEF